MTMMNLHINTFGWTNGISLEPGVCPSRHNFGREFSNPSSIR